MRDLIDRLEKATGPDRELDEAIACASDPGSHCAIYCIGDDSPVWFRTKGGKIDLPYFTASLDAAMTLVPDGRHWFVGSVIDGSGFVSHLDQQGKSSKATIPAIALCIAALKARTMEPK